MYGAKDIISKGNRKEFPVTDRIVGLNSIITTKSELANVLGISESDIINLEFDNDNNEIRWHHLKGYTISSGAFNSRSGNVEQKERGDAIQLYESSRVYQVNGFAFSESAAHTLIFHNMTSIGNEGLRDLINTNVFESPKLKTIGNGGLAFGLNGPTVFIDFPDLENGSFENISGRVRTTNIFPKITTFDIDVVVSLNRILSFPFSQSVFTGTTLSSGSFRWFNSFNEHLELPQITGTIDNLSFRETHNMPSLNLANVTYLGSRFLENGNNMMYLDIRSATSIVDNTVTLRNLPNGGTLEANIIHKNVSNNNSNHSRIQNLINKGWTVNWYDDNGNLVSTTN